MRPLEDSVALVTGGASGIGAAVVRRLRSIGAHVVVADVDVAGGEALAHEVGATFVRCDVTVPEDSVSAVGVAEEVYGGLDVVHLNAGVVTGFTTLDDFSLPLYRRAMGINLDGVVFGVVAALPALRRRQGGQILVTASLAGLVGATDDPIYTANKHAVVGLVRSLGPTLAPDGVLINAVCPGFVETPLLAEHVDAFRQAGFPLLTAEEIADTAIAAIESGDSGQAWFHQPGRKGEPYRFRGLPGPAVPGAEGLAPPTLR